MLRYRTHGLGARLAATLLALVASLALCAAAHAQKNTKPISRKGLVEAVKLNGLSTPEFVQFIERRGVDFQMTSDAEQELKGVGARPEVIEAARVNYRPLATATNTPPSSGASYTPTKPHTPTGQPVPSGPPLSKAEVVTMLQAGSPSSRVEQFVEARGVTFSLTPETTNEIKAAGGDRSLIGAITEKSPTSNAGVASAIPDTTPSGPSYDDYIDKVSSSISYNDWNGAINYARQAIQLDQSQPLAYQLLGTILLYGRQDINGAEQAMRAAIERGGSAVFHVYHDHNGNFTQYCEGSFFVNKGGVSFKANDGQDTFETVDTNIKEAKTNGFVGANIGAFHIKPVQKINGRDNFNFAPGSQNRGESMLIIRLIQNYQ
jgi:hypothetical protein